MPKTPNTQKDPIEGKDALVASRDAQPETFDTNYWPADDLDEDNAPPKTKFGGVRRYWHLQQGATIHGLYLGTEVLMMPKYGEPDTKEERAFIVLELKAPPGYKGTKKYGTLVKRPRVEQPEVAGEGEIVYVGVRAQLQKLVLLSALKIKTHLSIRVVSQERTARNFKLWTFEFTPRETDLPATWSTMDKDPLKSMFQFNDMGYHAAKNLFKLVIPPATARMFEVQFPALSAGEEKKAIAAGDVVTPEIVPEPKAIPAQTAQT